MINHIPFISVIMPVYNTPKEMLIESIQSILDQTFGDFEFLIGDDGSEMDFSDIKEMFDDERIIWIRNEENIGITKTLNRLLDLAKGRYIARMDADDLSLPTRFEEQIKFMETNKKFIVCGTQIRSFGKFNKLWYWEDSRIREEREAYLFFMNVAHISCPAGVGHPTAMIRKSMLDKYHIRYNEKYAKAQDYELWIQCIRYGPIATLPKVLLKYRVSNVQVSSTDSVNQMVDANNIRLEQLDTLDIVPTEEEKKLHVAFCLGKMHGTVEDMHVWMNKLKRANKEKKYYDHKYFNVAISNLWYMICACEYRLGNKAFRWEYIRSIRPLLMLRRKAKLVKYLIIKHMNR